MSYDFDHRHDDRYDPEPGDRPARRDVEDAPSIEDTEEWTEHEKLVWGEDS